MEISRRNFLKGSTAISAFALCAPAFPSLAEAKRQQFLPTDRTIYVSPYGCDKSSGLTKNTALQTIKEACDRVTSAYTRGHSMEIYIMPGEYTIEGIVSPENTLTIVG